jgi:hypothetical protein
MLRRRFERHSMADIAKPLVELPHTACLLLMQCFWTCLLSNGSRASRCWSTLPHGARQIIIETFIGSLPSLSFVTVWRAKPNTPTATMTEAASQGPPLACGFDYRGGFQRRNQNIVDVLKAGKQAQSPSCFSLLQSEGRQESVYVVFDLQGVDSLPSPGSQLQLQVLQPRRTVVTPAAGTAQCCPPCLSLALVPCHAGHADTAAGARASRRH